MGASRSLPSNALGGWLRAHSTLAQFEPLTHFLLQFQSDHTRRNYFSDIEHFFTFWNESGINLGPTLNAISEKHIVLWLEQFKQSSTRARKLASLSSFMKFCEIRRWIEHNPCTLVKRPIVSNRKTSQALNEEEVECLMRHLHFRAFNFVHTGAHAARQKGTALLRFSVLHTLFTVGMRVDELCEMRICDLDLASEFKKLRFVTKGGDEHTTLISASCAEVIQFYLAEMRVHAAAKDTVFIRVQDSSKPVKISQTGVFQMIRCAAHEAGINKTLSPHSARATVATVLHRSGVPLGFIQRLLNHKQITTTAKYVKKANERSESAALKAPVASWLTTEETSD